MHGINFFCTLYSSGFPADPKPQYQATASGYVVRLVGGALVGRQAYAEFTQLMKVMVVLSVMCLGCLAEGVATGLMMCMGLFKHGVHI